MAEQVILMKCKYCGKKFKDERALAMHTKAKHPQPEKRPLLKSKQKKMIRNWAIVLLIVGGTLGLLVYGFANAKRLPPTIMDGHIEENPPSHILKEPMPDVIQKHMLEHADGNGPPGIIVNYNCEKYSCEPGIVEKLEQFATDYPSNVYVAPYPMDAKIALTKLGRIQVLEEYDAEAIESFIRGA